MHTKQTYIDVRQKPAVVYWIHYPEHTKPYEEGYIGISTNLNKRLQQHKTRSMWMFNRLMKGAVVEIIASCNSLQEAAVLEKQYRPNCNIGWNLNPGGDIPPSQQGKKQTTNLLRGEQRTPRQKAAAQKHKEIMKNRTSPNKGKCFKILIDDVLYESAYQARDKTGFSLSKVYRIGVRQT